MQSFYLREKQQQQKKKHKSTQHNKTNKDNKKYNTNKTSQSRLDLLYNSMLSFWLQTNLT